MKNLLRLTLAAVTLAITTATPTVAQDYPNKPIRIVVPFSPGGNVDITARTLAPALGEALGQTVVVENRSGAGGTLGADIVAKAAPDGYSLLMGSNSTVSVAPALYPRSPYHPIRDFSPIGLAAATPFVLVAHPSVPATSAKDFVDLAKSQPDAITMASGGTGSSNHLVGELFQSVTGIKLLHVPYKGAGAAGADLLGGQVQVLFDQLSASTSNIKGNRIRALAVTSSERAAAIPDVPTMRELGIEGMDVINITGLLAPAGTPESIIAKLNAALVKALSRSDVRERFSAIGLEPIGGTPERFAEYIKEDFAKWTKVIKDGNIRVE